MAGDFKVHFGTVEVVALRLCDVVLGFDMQQTIKETTRQKSCLDNIFVSANMNVHHTEVTDLYLSDHLGQIIDIFVPSHCRVWYQIKQMPTSYSEGIVHVL
ncbi:hypothetical protein WA026_019948 [Henosepilachna vigintioctopunctata]|uniref:Uncharacterized protein n=1 Tax=Henosepilachna vigintioctopunctata TaxID=420089 RepID=A0AAW1V0Z1_9CUCU